jgi:hypothetical protein
LREENRKVGQGIALGREGGGDVRNEREEEGKESS